MPVRSRSLMSGVRKPLLRSLLIGKLKYGAHRIGTPLKSSFTPRALPTPPLTSSSIESACSSQSMSSAGQVVNSTLISESVLSL